MDALFYWVTGLAISAFAGGVWLLWQSDKKEQARRLEADIERLTVANTKQKEINDVQAQPFPDAATADSWVRSRRPKQ